MRSKSLWAMPVLAPATIPAAGVQGGDFSYAACLAQMLGSLAMVVGLIYLLSHVYRRWLAGNSACGGKRGHIRVVETRHLAPKKSLLLVKVADEYLLLGSGNDGIRLIKQIAVTEEMDCLGETAPAFPGGSFQAKLDDQVKRMVKRMRSLAHNRQTSA